MATNTYIGAQGGDWFDPSNWSLGTIPAAGDTADLFGPSGSHGTTIMQPSGVDATTGTVSGVTIDIRDVAGGPYENGAGVIYPYSPQLTATTLGTAGAPVAIEVTADGGTASEAALIVGTLNGSIEVAAGQSLVIEGGASTINGDITIGAGSSLSFQGDNHFHFEPPDVVLNGRVLVDGGVFETDGHNIHGTGQFEIADGGTIELDPYLVSDEQVGITFDRTGGTLVANRLGDEVPATFTGFGSGDVILAYDHSRGEYPVRTTYSNGELTITQVAGGGSDTFTFAGDYALNDFAVTRTGGIIEITFAPCFVTGTLIETTGGPVPVEDLREGDRVRLHDGASGTISWIGHRRASETDVIRIPAGTLGATRDLLVSEDHGLFVDGALVPAGLLADGGTMTRERHANVVFWHVELERHAVLLADGVAAESYLDTGNRRQFGNCPLGYEPAASDEAPCAALVLARNPLVAQYGTPASRPA